LRDVVVPSRLMGKFMNLAQQNTNQNIETCGILAGTLVSFIVTGVVNAQLLHLLLLYFLTNGS
jgi:STAM-binding protein